MPLTINNSIIQESADMRKLKTCQYRFHFIVTFYVKELPC